MFFVNTEFMNNHKNNKSSKNNDYLVFQNIAFETKRRKEIQPTTLYDLIVKRFAIRVENPGARQL
jgi:hypothetical protein